MLIQIKLEEGAKMPYRSTEGAAAWDLFANIEQEVTIYPNDSAVINTGVAAALPAGTYLDLRIRSGLSTKHGIMLLNGAAVIDEDYRGFIKVPVINMNHVPYTIKPGEKIAQGILLMYMLQEFHIVDELPPSKRGNRGFGSTGK